jgi:small subunit ribosomal protein S16
VFLERLGHYNPLTDPADVFIDEEKALKWLRRGAQPSDTAKRLLSKSGILMKFEYEKSGRPMPGTEAAETAEEEVQKVDDTEPTETQETESEAGTLLTEETSDESAEEEE